MKWFRIILVINQILSTLNDLETSMNSVKKKRRKTSMNKNAKKDL